MVHSFKVRRSSESAPRPVFSSSPGCSLARFTMVLARAGGRRTRSHAGPIFIRRERTRISWYTMIWFTFCELKKNERRLL